MINALLIIKDIYYLKEIINELNKLNSKLRFCQIANNENEALLALKNTEIDIILIDFVLYKRNKELLIDDAYAMFIFRIKNQSVQYFDMNENPLTIKEISIKISKVKRKKIKQEEFQKVKIQKELEYLGYNPNYKGTIYLMESIYMLLNIDLDDNYNLEREIYPIVAKKYNRTVHNIKCNIINSTDIMVYDCKEEKLNKYLGFYCYSKPGPKKIIYSVLKNILKK